LGGEKKQETADDADKILGSLISQVQTNDEKPGGW
jgi:hypothetical protein